MMYGQSDGGWWGVGMMFVSLLFLALIVLGAVLVARSFSNDGKPSRGSDAGSALAILDERFARGEIDQAEYDERRRILTGA